MTDRFSCARASRGRAEPLYATASTVHRWIIVEQPGPWGTRALTESRLPEETGEALEERARQLQARVVLVRRHGRQNSQGAPPACFVAHTAPGNAWIEALEVDKPAELLDLDLTGLRSGDSVGGRLVEHPLYLVCTNGSHDACCAEFGRPLAAALDTARPTATWECSHIGGDRFAANLVCFPHGVYYGRLDPDDVVDVVEAYERARLDLDHFRGRSCYPFIVQAADHLVRREHGLDAIDAIAFESGRRIETLGDTETYTVTFASPGGARYVATVSRRPAAATQQTTCHAADVHRPPRYELLDLA